MIDTLTLVQDRGRILIQNARRRRLGSLFVPVRRSYLLIMPGILVAGALVCWALLTNTALILGAFLLAGVALYLVFDLLGRTAPLRLSTILAFTLGLGYGLGTLNTWFTLPRSGETLGEFMHISTADLTQAMGGILLSTALMLTIGELYEKPIFGEDFVLDFNNRAVVLVTLGTLFRLATFATGAVGGFSAQTGTASGHIGVLSFISTDLQSPLFALALCMAFNMRGRFTRWYMAALTMVLFLMAFPGGRRSMIYSIVLGIIGLRIGRYRPAFSPLKKVIAVGVLGVLLYVASIGFFYFRVAGFALIHPSFSQRAHAVVTLVKNKSYSELKEQFAANVEQRTFILGFLGELVGYTDVMPGAHGEDMASQFELALPSVLYPGKNVYFTEELLSNDLFGAHYIDEANSVFTTGAVDFGLWGMFFYPLFFIFLLRYFIEFCGEVMPAFAACFVILLAISGLLEPEVNVTSYFISIREGLIVGMLVWFIMRLPEFRVRNANL